VGLRNGFELPFDTRSRAYGTKLFVQWPPQVFRLTLERKRSMYRSGPSSNAHVSPCSRARLRNQHAC
jgi:hypothetical protein